MDGLKEIFRILLFCLCSVTAYGIRCLTRAICILLLTLVCKRNRQQAIEHLSTCNYYTCMNGLPVNGCLRQSTFYSYGSVHRTARGTFTILFAQDYNSILFIWVYTGLGNLANRELANGSV